MIEAWNDLISGEKQGSVRCLVRTITAVENRAPGCMEAMKLIHPDRKPARVIGITGPPGSEKINLTDRIPKRQRNVHAKEKVR